MAFCTVDDIKNRFDVRVVGDLLSDDDTRVAAASFTGNARLTAAIDDATSEMRSAFEQAERYTAAQLQDLEDASDVRLARICAILAMGYLYSARGATVPARVQDQMDDARQQLEEFRTGKRVLNVSTAKVAGSTPSPVKPSLAQRRSLNRAGDLAFFPKDDRSVL